MRASSLSLILPFILTIGVDGQRDRTHKTQSSGHVSARSDTAGSGSRAARNGGPCTPWWHELKMALIHARSSGLLLLALCYRTEAATRRRHVLRSAIGLKPNKVVGTRDTVRVKVGSMMTESCITRGRLLFFIPMVILIQRREIDIFHKYRQTKNSKWMNE